MKTKDNLCEQITSTPLADVKADFINGKWNLTFTREFNIAPDKLWDILTDPTKIKGWAPYDVNRNLGTPGPVTMIECDEPGEKQGDVTVADRPKLLEHHWGVDLLRWELTPTAGGTRLKLRHTLKAEHWLAKCAGGWHICLFVAASLATDHPAHRIVGMESMDYGWPELHVRYAEVLGVEPTGFPEDE